MTESFITPNQLPTTSAILAQGLADNLPAILDGLQAIYTLRAKEGAFREALQARCVELQINSQNFSALIQGLTELSKAEGADEETKTMYREMIRTLFELFTTRSQASASFSDFMNS
jgi:hypothetical protein